MKITINLTSSVSKTDHKFIKKLISLSHLKAKVIQNNFNLKALVLYLKKTIKQKNSKIIQKY